jgi:hypothetical protein
MHGKLFVHEERPAEWAAHAVRFLDDIFAARRAGVVGRV